MILPYFSPIELNDVGNIICKKPIEECKRLANELRSKPARVILNALGLKVDIPAYLGFNVEDCDLKKITDYIGNPSIKKSKSMYHFLYSIFAVRFSVDFALYKRNTENIFLKAELERIESEAKNDMYWFGRTGYQNMVSYTDDSIINNNTGSKSGGGVD